MKKMIILSGLATATFLSSLVVFAADQAQDKEKDVKQDQSQSQQTTGNRLMTPEERQSQRAKMRRATTREEREKVRAEHHEKMKKRAKEQGKVIPENPPAGGMGGERWRWILITPYI